jgi:hypothetical protein
MSEDWEGFSEARRPEREERRKRRRRRGGDISGSLDGGISFASGFPLDVAIAQGLSPNFAVGIGALTTAWSSGPLFDLRVGASTSTIHAVRGGYPDVVGIATALGIDPITGVGGGYISKWYDQSGNGKDYTQTTHANQPALWLILGKVFIAFNGVLAASVGLSSPSFLQNLGVLVNQSFSFLASIIGYSSTCAASGSDLRFSTVLGTGQGVGNSSFTQLDFADKYPGPSGSPPAASGTLAFIEDVPNAIALAGGNLAISDNPALFGATGAPGGTTMYFNSSSVSGAAFSAQASLVTVLGNEVAAGMGGLFNGRMKGLIATGTTFTAGSALALQNAFAGWSGITLSPAKHLNVVFDGASSSLGQGSDPSGGYLSVSGGGYGVCEVLKDQFGASNISWRNIAISGNTITNSKTNWDSGFGGAACYDASYSKNALFVGGEGIYLLVTNGNTGAQAYTAFLAYLTSVKSTRSWAQIAVTTYNTSSLGGEYDVLNAALLSGAQANGYVCIDMSKDALVGNIVAGYANADGHPTVKGSFRIAQFTAPFVQGLL